MGDLISRLQGDGAILWRPDVKKVAVNKSTIRPKSQPCSVAKTVALRLGAKYDNCFIKISENQSSF